VHRDGVKLFAETLATLGGSCTLVCLSGLADAWQLLEGNLQLGGSG